MTMERTLVQFMSMTSSTDANFTLRFKATDTAGNVTSELRYGSNSGSVYIYDANNLSATPTKLTAFDGAQDDFFGSRVSVTDDKIIVSAYGDDEHGDRSGSVYVYDANNLSATPTKLTACDGACV